MNAATPSRPWWVLAGALLVGLVMLLSPFGERLALPLLDAQASAAAPKAALADIAVVDIDDASLRALRPALGPWPYPRDVYALALDTLRAAGARAVALDLLFADTAPGDRALARALQRADLPVVLAAAALAPPRGATVDAGARDTAVPLVPPPAELMAGRPAAIGLITSPLDVDGRLRRMPVAIEVDGRRWPSFPIAVWEAVDRPRAAGAGPAAREPLAVDARGRFVLPAHRELPAVLPFSVLAEVALERRPLSVLAAAVRDRVVFIGSSAMQSDAVLTPQGQLSGTLVLAHTYAALRQGALLRPPALPWDAALLALALVPVLVVVARGRTRVRHDAAIAALTALGLAALVLAALFGLRMQSNATPALLALACGALLTLALRQRELLAAQRRLAYEQALAVAASRTKSEFLANVSHEIRTPLNALLGMAELLARTPLDDQQQRHVEVLRRAGGSLLTLINDLLDLSRIEAGRLELHEAPFELRPPLSQMMALMQPRAAERGIALALDVGAEVPHWVSGDAGRLVQALTNLVGNALKFTPSGSVRLEVSVEADARIRFEVIDTGIGIAPSKLESIFEPFTQADGSITRAFGGTGLGLAITRSLVRQMGGEITVSSRPGLGSTFALSLPLPACAPPVAVAPAPAGDAAAAPPTHGLRVLLAEDNEVNVYVFRALLEGAGCQIDVAGNGHAAVRLWQQGRYDLVFMDLQMPGLDGHAATAEIRRLERERGLGRVPIVALSAHAFESDRAASLAAGCDEHLTKPVSRDTLLATLRRLPMAPTGAPEPPAAVAPPAIDHAEARRRLGGDAALHARVLTHAAVFIATWPRSSASARAQHDAEQLARLAHDLKGIAGTIGAGTLAAAARDLEAALGRPPRLVEGSAALAAADAALHAALAPVMNELASNLPSDADPGPTPAATDRAV